MIQKYIISLPPITKKNSQQILTNHRTGKPFIAPQQAVQEVRTGRHVVSRPKAESPAVGPLPRRHGILYADAPQSRPHELDGSCP